MDDFLGDLVGNFFGEMPGGVSVSITEQIFREVTKSIREDFPLMF